MSWAWLTDWRVVLGLTAVLLLGLTAVLLLGWLLLCAYAWPGDGGV